MPTAKTYETWDIKDGPYGDPKKQYVKVMNPKNGMLKEVRWYTDAQRISMDKKSSSTKADSFIEDNFNARLGFGFGTEGYILLVDGSTADIEAWKNSLPPYTIWNNTLFDWFIPADREPEEIPENINCIPLTWDQVCLNGSPTKIRDREEVRKLAQELLGVQNKSQFQGTIGEVIQRTVTIKNNIMIESKYGKSRIHIMKDNDGNEYVWNTASTSLTAGKTFVLKMKVKDHKEYQGVKQTIVYYCKVE